ncbi:MAG TPA: hypothetical protein VGF14_02675 [Alphaproteobacteria bacterium]
MNKNFWKIIGAHRTRNFGIVVVINALLVALLIMWQLPKREEVASLLQQTEQKKMDIQNQIVELPKKFEIMQKNEEAYEAMRLRGFFSGQDRIAFRQLLNDLRLKTGVRQVSYDVKPLTLVNNNALSNTDKELVKSEVTVSLRSMTDLEMREFVHALQDSTPGFSTIKAQSFEVADELNDMNLIRLGNGDVVDFVMSSYSFDWYTLRDKIDPLEMQTPENGQVPVAGMPVAPADATGVVPAPAVPVNPDPGVVPPAAPAPAPGVQ